MTKLELKSSHEVIDTVNVADVESISYGKRIDPRLLTVLMKDGKRLFCDEVCPVQEEPVSEDLEEAAYKYACKCQPLRTDYGYTSPNPEVKVAVLYGAQWQKAKDESTTEDLEDYINELSKQFPEVSFAKLSRIAVRVAKWQKEQFEKNRLKHCNNITNEQAELEQEFVDQHLDKHNRMPTFLDAIEYGMDLQKKLMMKGLCFETKVYLESDGCAEDFNESEWLDLEKTEITELPVDALGLKAGDKVKIIIVKED